MGIEPTRSAWKAEVLPLNYTRTALICLLILPQARLFVQSILKIDLLMVKCGNRFDPGVIICCQQGKSFILA
jgi:hypothetical protein